MTRNWLHVAGTVALLSLAGSAWYVAAATVRFLHAWESIPGSIRALDATVQALPPRILSQVLPPVLEEIDEQATRIEKDANFQVGRVVDLTDKRTGQLVDLTRGAFTGVNTTLAQLDASIAQISASATKTLNTTTALMEQDRPEVFGLLRDSRLAAAEFARSNIYVRQQLPSFLVTFGQIEAHVNDATQAAAKASLATQHTMEHLDTASKPLPTWLRVTLGVAPPLANVGASAVGAGAAAGLFH